MNHIKGHELIDECWEYLKLRINQFELYEIDMELKIGYDDCDGHFYGFSYFSKFESEAPRHEGEKELVFITFYADSGDVTYTFDNNGYTQEFTTLEEFKYCLT